MLSADEALRRILELVPELPGERVPLTEALGRALTEDVLAVRTLPPWDNSAMDGYALRADDAAAPGARLWVVAEIFAGQQAARPLAVGECARIMTGGPLPQGADAVEMQEKVHRLSQSEVELTEAVSRGQFVHARGEDAQAGQVLLPRGTVLGLPEAALLWGQALAYAPVPRRPRVAVLAAGDELCAVDAPLPDRLIDVNTPALCEAVRRAGGEPRALGIAADALPDLGAALARATDVDVVVTAGGASVGDRDLLREALSRHGVVLDFWRVAIKPGKPLAVGRRGRTLFFALPGNPVSALVTFELFVRPALRRMSGHAEVSPLTIPAVAAAPMRKPAGLRHYLRVTAAWRDGALWATPLGSQNSGAVRSAAGPPTSASFPKRSPLGRWATR